MLGRVGEGEFQQGALTRSPGQSERAKDCDIKDA